MRVKKLFCLLLSVLLLASMGNYPVYAISNDPGIQDYQGLPDDQDMPDRLQGDLDFQDDLELPVNSDFGEDSDMGIPAYVDYAKAERAALAFTFALEIYESDKDISSVYNLMERLGGLNDALSGGIAVLQMNGRMGDPAFQELSGIYGEVQGLNGRLDDRFEELDRILCRVQAYCAEEDKPRYDEADDWLNAWKDNLYRCRDDLDSRLNQYDKAIQQNIQNWWGMDHTRENYGVYLLYTTDLDTGELHSAYSNAEYSDEFPFNADNGEIIERHASFGVPGSCIPVTAQMTFDPDTYKDQFVESAASILLTTLDEHSLDFVTDDFYAAWESLDNDAKAQQAAIYAQNLLDAITYRAACEEATAHEADVITPAIEDFKNLCAYLTDADNGLSRYFKTEYLSHAFEGEVKGAAADFINSMTAVCGFYGAFALTAASLDPDLAADTRTDLQNTWIESINYISETITSALTGQDNFCYTVGKVLEFTEMSVGATITAKYDCDTADRSAYAAYTDWDNSSWHFYDSSGNRADLPMCLDEKAVSVIYSKFEVENYYQWYEDSYNEWLNRNGVDIPSDFDDVIMTAYEGYTNFNLSDGIWMLAKRLYGTYFTNGDWYKIVKSNTSLDRDCFVLHDKVTYSYLDPSDGSISSNKILAARALYMEHHKYWYVDEGTALEQGCGFSVDEQKKDFGLWPTPCYHVTDTLTQTAPIYMFTVSNASLDDLHVPKDSPLRDTVSYTFPSAPESGAAAESEVAAGPDADWSVVNVRTLNLYPKNDGRLEEGLSRYVDSKVNEANQKGIRVSLSETEKENLVSQLKKTIQTCQTELKTSGSLTGMDLCGINGNEDAELSLAMTVLPESYLDEAGNSMISAANMDIMALYEPDAQLRFELKKGKISAVINPAFNILPQLVVWDPALEEYRSYEIPDEYMQDQQLNVNLIVPAASAKDSGTVMILHHGSDDQPVTKFESAVEANGNDYNASVAANCGGSFEFLLDQTVVGIESSDQPDATPEEIKASTDAFTTAVAKYADGKDISKLSDLLSRFGGLNDNVSGGIAILQLTGLMDDPAFPNLTGILAEVQGLSQITHSISTDLTRTIQGLQRLADNEDEKARLTKAQTYVDNWDKYNTNTLKAISDDLDRYTQMVSQGIEDWWAKDHNTEDYGISLLYTQDQEGNVYSAYSSADYLVSDDFPRAADNGEEIALAFCVGIPGEFLPVTSAYPFNPENYTIEFKALAAQSFIKAANEKKLFALPGFYYSWETYDDDAKEAAAQRYAADLLNTLVYQIACSKVKESTWTESVKDEVLGYFSTLQSGDGINSILKAEYITHGFEKEVKEEITDLIDKMVAVTGFYGVFALTAVSQDSNMDDDSRKAMQDGWVQNTSAMDGKKASALTSQDNFCYVAGAPADFTQMTVSASITAKYDCDEMEKDGYACYEDYDYTSWKTYDSSGKKADVPSYLRDEASAVLYHEFEQQSTKGQTAYAAWLSNNGVNMPENFNHVITTTYSGASTYKLSDGLWMLAHRLYGTWFNTGDWYKIVKSNTSLDRDCFVLHDKVTYSYMDPSDGSISKDRILAVRALYSEHHKYWIVDESTALEQESAFDVSEDKKEYKASILGSTIFRYHETDTLSQSETINLLSLSDFSFDNLPDDSPLRDTDDYVLPHKEQEEPLAGPDADWSAVNVRTANLYQKEDEKLDDGIENLIDRAIHKAGQDGLTIALSKTERTKIAARLKETIQTCQEELKGSRSLTDLDLCGLNGNDEAELSLAEATLPTFYLDEAGKSVVSAANMDIMAIYEPYATLRFESEAGKERAVIEPAFYIVPQLVIWDTELREYKTFPISDESLSAQGLHVNLVLPAAAAAGKETVSLRFYDNSDATVQSFETALYQNGNDYYAAVSSDRRGTFELLLNQKTIALSKKTQSIKVSPQSPITLMAGKTKTLKVTGAKGAVTFKSANTSIASVNKTSGKITAKSPGTVKITVTAAAKGCYKKATATVTVKVIPAKTSLTSVKKVSKGIKAVWKKNTSVTGYQLQYSLKKDFSSGKKTLTISSKNTTSKTVTGLKAGKTYYFKIRTYKKVNGKNYYSSWSGIRSVKNKCLYT